MPSHLMMFPTVPSPSLSPYPFGLELWTDLRFPFLAYCCPHGISRPLLAETARWVERSLAASVATRSSPALAQVSVTFYAVVSSALVMASSLHQSSPP